jgi:hypothetical protein
LLHTSTSYEEEPAVESTLVPEIEANIPVDEDIQNLSTATAFDSIEPAVLLGVVPPFEPADQAAVSAPLSVHVDASPLSEVSHTLSPMDVNPRSSRTPRSSKKKKKKSPTNTGHPTSTITSSTEPSPEPNQMTPSSSPEPSPFKYQTPTTGSLDSNKKPMYSCLKNSPTSRSALANPKDKSSTIPMVKNTTKSSKTFVKRVHFAMEHATRNLHQYITEKHAQFHRNIPSHEKKSFSPTTPKGTLKKNPPTSSINEFSGFSSNLDLWSFVKKLLKMNSKTQDFLFVGGLTFTLVCYVFACMYRFVYPVTVPLPSLNSLEKDPIELDFSHLSMQILHPLNDSNGLDGNNGIEWQITGFAPLLTKENGPEIAQYRLFLNGQQVASEMAFFYIEKDLTETSSQTFITEFPIPLEKGQHEATIEVQFAIPADTIEQESVYILKDSVTFQVDDTFKQTSGEISKIKEEMESQIGEEQNTQLTPSLAIISPLQGEVFVADKSIVLEFEAVAMTTSDIVLSIDGVHVSNVLGGAVTTAIVNTKRRLLLRGLSEGQHVISLQSKKNPIVEAVLQLEIITAVIPMTPATTVDGSSSLPHQKELEQKQIEQLHVLEQDIQDTTTTTTMNTPSSPDMLRPEGVTQLFVEEEEMELDFMGEVLTAD